MTAEWRKTNRTQKGAFLGRSLRQNLRTCVAAAVLWLPVAWANCHLRGALGLETYSKVFEDNTWCILTLWGQNEFILLLYVLSMAWRHCVFFLLECICISIRICVLLSGKANHCLPPWNTWKQNISGAAPCIQECLSFFMSMGKNKLINHADILRSLRVEVSVTHVMFPVGDCHVNGWVASVAFHLVTCLRK